MKQLEPISIVAPGFYGLNTQESSVTLSTNYALVAENCVIDQLGRLGARKGWTLLTPDGSTELSTQYVEGLFEHIDADNASTILAAGNNKIMELQSGDTLVDITPVTYTISDNNWKSANVLDTSLLVQAEHEPLVYCNGASADIQTLSDYLSNEKGITDSPSFGTSYPNDVIAAYGRYWSHDGSTVYWSTDIADSAFPAFSGGTSGTLNISAVLPKNVDNIVALASHNNFLIIFCERNIVLYSGADNPLDKFALHDVITGVGCIARDSVQATGDDIFFLSDTGVRSLGRVIQEKSLPMHELTLNVRDEFIELLNTELATNGSSKICSVYSENNAFYLISLPSLSTVYCLDTRQRLESGASRVTMWTKHKIMSFLRTRDRAVYLGKQSGIGVYEGYQDNGVPYRMRFSSAYIDMNASTTKKLLKRINTIVIGGSGQVFVIKAGYDYFGPAFSYSFTINEGGVYEYGIAEYALSEYAAGVLVDKLSTPALGTGEVVQIGFEANVDGAALSVQRLDIFVKTGRIN